MQKNKSIITSKFTISFTMPSSSNSSDHPTDGQAAAGKAGRSDGNMKKSSNSSDGAASKQGDALRRRSDDTKKRKQEQRNNQNDKPKRRRPFNPPQRAPWQARDVVRFNPPQRAPWHARRAPHVMPEARDVVQDLSLGYAYISSSSESESDDDDKPFSCGCCTNMEESIRNHTKLYTSRTHPDFFVRVDRSGSIHESDWDTDDNNDGNNP